MKFFMPILKLVLCSSLALHVQAVKPALVIKDSCGNDIAHPTECFAMKELNTNKWVTASTSSNRKWLGLSDQTATMFAFKNEKNDTNTSLGCRVHYLMIDGQWSTLDDDREFFAPSSSGVRVIPAQTWFGGHYASMISQNSDFSYSLHSGQGSCEGHGCVGPYITKVKADNQWLEASEKAARIAKYEIYYQKGIDCEKTTFSLDVVNLQTCNPTNRLQTEEMKTECT